MVKQLSVSLLFVGVICCIAESWTTSEWIDDHLFESLGRFTANTDELAKATAISQQFNEEREAREQMAQARENALQELRLHKRSLIEVAASFRKAILRDYPKYLSLLRKDRPTESELECVAYNLVLTLRYRLEDNEPQGWSCPIVRDLESQLSDSSFLRACRKDGGASKGD
jgi:hypothetical protein